VDDIQLAIFALKAEVDTTGGDSTVSDLVHPIIGMLEVVRGFKKSGMYREARYYARYVARSTDELSNAYPELRSLPDVRKAVNSVFDLPDVSPGRREDRSIPEPELAGEGPYQARFPVGTKVRVVDDTSLRTFKSEWHWHHPLQEEQLRFAGLSTTVRDIAYYHGGDALYTLADTGDYIWHEPCL